jgi:prefoldin subunit 5
MTEKDLQEIEAQRLQVTLTRKNLDKLIAEVRRLEEEIHIVRQTNEHLEMRMRELADENLKLLEHAGLLR